MPSNVAQHPLAFLVQVENAHDTLKIVARVVYTDPTHDRNNPDMLLNPSWDYGRNNASVFDGFEVMAYLGSLPHSAVQSELGTWGFGYRFKPFAIDKLAHAQAIARTFAKLDKGMKQLSDTEGYLRDDDFHAFILRVARVLKITTFHVRSTPQQFSYSGDRFRRTDGAGVQSYVEHNVRLSRDGKRSQILADMR